MADELLRRVLSGDADASIDFRQLCRPLTRLGFRERIRGSHHIFTKVGLIERVNLQRDGRHAKPYQVAQLRAIILKHGLARDE